MRRRTQVGFLVVVSIMLFFIVAPVVYTSRFGYTVFTSEGCGIVCSGYNMNRICYETLMYHFFGVGGAICHYEKGSSFIS